uniref:M23 family metallopeptidase n=1 Tax=Allorhizocola rhizosphaerae TaxID=1872709 RepID=UPI0013C2B4FA
RQGRERLGRFAAVTHRGGDVAQFNALISAGSPSQLALRYGYTIKIAEAKKGAIDQLLGAQREAKQASNDAGMARRAADQALAAAQAAVDEAKAAKEAAERTQHELVALAAQQQEAAARAEAHRDEVMQRHEELKRESERIAAELLAGEAGPSLRPGARLLMPVRGWKSSNFGMRYDPYYHVWQLHAGVDIAAGGGEPIYAAADGQVASAGWRGGYGNYTCLNHGYVEGQRLSTCYAHQSTILVGHGQWVSRGQLIGRVGTTGASTGNHLHFEVRLDGTPVEPENWLPTCLC